MKQKFLLLASAAVAMTAAAESYPLGEAFAYDFGAEDFAFVQAGTSESLNIQYPGEALQGQASLAEGWGMAQLWFNAKHFDKEGDQTAMNEYAPVVDYAGTKCVRVQTATWDGFGNLNFALPQVGKPCRVRLVYKLDVTGIDNPFNGQKPFQVKLMDDGDQDTPDYPFVAQPNEEFWTNSGWRVTEFLCDLSHDHYYASILFDAGGLTCSKNTPFYLREVSVVPVEKLTNCAATAEGITTVVAEAPELVTISGGAGVENIDVEAANAPAEYFNLQGIRVAEPANGIFIRRQGNKVTKVVL